MKIKFTCFSRQWKKLSPWVKKNGSSSFIFEAENQSETCWNLDFYIHAYKIYMPCWNSNQKIYKTYRKYKCMNYFYIMLAVNHIYCLKWEQITWNDNNPVFLLLHICIVLTKLNVFINILLCLNTLRRRSFCTIDVIGIKHTIKSLMIWYGINIYFKENIKILNEWNK